MMLTVVEKVILLQEADIFEYTKTEDLAHVAAITQEMTLAAEESIYISGESSDAMYMVIDGKVRLHHDGETVLMADSKQAFGTWALFDDAPRLVSAITAQESRLLKIDKEDFFDLLSDHVDITQSIFKSLVQKLRSLVSDGSG